jgi:hypothetical protein
MKTSFLKIGLMCAGLFVGALQASALDGIVIANDSVPAASLDAGALKDIYAGKTMYWEGGQAVVIVVAGDKADAALEQASGMNASAFKTFWQRLAFSGRGQQPKKVDDTAAAMALVASTKGAIAIVPAGTELKGVKKIEVK